MDTPVAEINWLSAARFFLFGSRDLWFVVALPVFLYEVLNWSFMQVGGFLALWIIGYGIVQAFAPRLWRDTGRTPGGGASRFWVFILAAFPAGIAWCLNLGFPADIVLIAGLMLFGVVFAVNSALHSFLILAYSDADKVSMNVGFYYMANAGGRLIGTVMSGVIYQFAWVDRMLVVVDRVLVIGGGSVHKAAGNLRQTTYRVNIAGVLGSIGAFLTAIVR